MGNSNNCGGHNLPIMNEIPAICTRTTNPRLLPLGKIGLNDLPKYGGAPAMVPGK